MEFSRDALVPRTPGATIPLQVNKIGHSTLSAVDSGENASGNVREPAVSASYFEWAFTNKRSNLSNGGIQLPKTEDGLCQFYAPRAFSTCKAVTLGGAADGCLSAPEIGMRLHVNWGHASAQQLGRALEDSDGGNMHLLTCVDEVLGHCAVRRAFEKAPHVSIAGSSSVATSNEKLRTDLLFLDDILALRTMNIFSKYSLRKPERSKTPPARMGCLLQFAD